MINLKFSSYSSLYVTAVVADAFSLSVTVKLKLDIVTVSFTVGVIMGQSLIRI